MKPFSPALDRDCPDPHILFHDGLYYLYSTESAGWNVPFYTSEDLVEWEVGGDALPVLPHWVKRGWTWAPKVIHHQSGKFLMYYSARHRETNKQAVGVAYAKHPSGPFIPYPWPLIVGFIDADVFEDTDGSYIFYSAGCDDTQGAIWGQRLTPDGLSFMGEQVKLIEAEYDYEGNVVEGSVLLKRNGVYVMLYSINGFSSSRYAIHYAVSDDPLGPYSKPRDNCVLRACSGVDGPGHCDVSWPYMVFHGWHPGQIGYDNGHYRALYTAELEWNGVRPVVKREIEHACITA